SYTGSRLRLGCHARFAGKCRVLVNENSGRLFEGFAWGNCAVRFDGKQQLVEISRLADAGIFNLVADTRNGAEEGIEGNIVARLLAAALFDGAVPATDFNDKISGKTALIIIDSRDNMLRVDDLDISIGFDVFCCNRALAFLGDAQILRLLAVDAEMHAFQVLHDVDDIFADARQGCELVRCALDLEGRNSGTADAR